MADNRFRGPRMQKHWHSIGPGSIGFTANATFLAGSLNLDGPFTVIRMLGEYIVGVDAAPTAQDAARISVGIGVVSVDATVVGSTAMPDPGGEPDYPWLYWAEHPLFFVDTSLAGEETRSLRRSFDIRSMRKMKPREALAMVIEYQDIAGTPPIQVVSAQTRVLVAD